MISLIVPVYNEEEAIPLFYKEVKSKLSAYNFEIIFINDGSNDKTEDVINELQVNDKIIKMINFSRNFGKEAALFAGLEAAKGDAVIPIDVDLQDPIEVIPEMIERWENGYDVVLAKRIDRSTDSVIKRKTAEWFYSIHNKISSPKIESNVGDFRLMSRSVVNNILLLPERNLFMKGILSWVGGNVYIIEYKRAERIAGETKFNGWKLWNLALEGITSFSTIPLRVWTYVGISISLLSFIYGLWMIIEHMVWGNSVPGYSSIMVSILFLGGIQLIGIGILGEYIGRIYIESKKRPRYLVKNKK
ncbi:glycosyltransferase family 2 protein [Photobacterium angustum]